MARKKVVRGRTAAAKKRTAAATGRKTSRKRKAVAKQAVTKKTPKRKTVAGSRSKTAAARNKRVVKRSVAGKKLGRPRVAGTAELEQVFRKDREAREVFEFLGVKTLKELETLSPDEVIERLTAPMVRTVGRIRKALAINNRCLAGDQKFALDFQKELS